MRGKPGYEHLNEQLHILVEAELPIEIVDARLMQAREILADLLTPVVCSLHSSSKDLINLVFVYITTLYFVMFFRRRHMISTRNNSSGNWRFSTVV